MARQAVQSGLSECQAFAKFVPEESHFGAQNIAFAAQDVGGNALAAGQLIFPSRPGFCFLQQSRNRLKLGLPAQRPRFELQQSGASRYDVLRQQPQPPRQAVHFALIKQFVPPVFDEGNGRGHIARRQQMADSLFGEAVGSQPRAGTAVRCGNRFRPQ